MTEPLLRMFISKKLRGYLIKMNRIIRNIMSVANGYLKFVCLKITHNIKFGTLPRVSLHTEFAMDKKAELYIGNRFLMRGGSRIRVSEGSSLTIGNNVGIGPNCMVACHERITIGDNVQLSPNVQIYDHDHDYRHVDGLKSNHFKSTEIVIGNNVWIGANVVILRGTKIGNGSVVAAGAVIKGNYDDNSLILQKRSTEIVKINNSK